MNTPRTEWPLKTRHIHNHHFDSTIWDDLKFRDDDIVIATYAKSGTTWLQQIVSQLIFDGLTGLPVAERVPPKDVKLPEVENQTHRRFSRPICRSMPSCSLHKPNISTLVETGATWSGACTITTPTPMSYGTGR